MALAKIRFLFCKGASFSVEARLVSGLKYYTPGACPGHKYGVWFDFVWSGVRGFSGVGRP